MTSGKTFPQRIALRCDATSAIGVGHVVRCLALGEELRDRGVDVVLWGRIEDTGGTGGLSWLTDLVAGSGLQRLTPADDVTGQLGQAADERFTAVVLDGYRLPPSLGEGLRRAGRRVLALVDDGFGADQVADVYVDQNLAARPHRGGPAGSHGLAGADYTLLRDAVLQRRRDPGQITEIRCVLAVFGGTDPAGAAPLVIPALLATDAVLDITVVSSGTTVGDRLAALPLPPHQRLRVIPPQPDLAGVAAAAELVVSAAGTTVWELLAIGVPTAVVCAVDNQEPGYRALLDADVVTGLGSVPSFDPATATAALSELIRDPRRAVALARRGQRLIDGSGRRRVADALLTGGGAPPPATARPPARRPAGSRS